jgi:LysR family transcriptional activator of nhaA
MQSLNYHHLLYFHAVVHHGSLAAAAQALRLSLPTVLVQIRALEQQLGDKLFVKRGRRLVLTDFGQMVHRYASEIFGLGQEMIDAIEGRPAQRSLRLIVGVANVLPKLVVSKLLEPAWSLSPQCRLVCKENDSRYLTTQLAEHKVDIVFSDGPAKGVGTSKVYSHLLGECGVSFFAAPKLCKSLKGDFPKSLDGAPLLMPGAGTSLRTHLERWFAEENVKPIIVAEFDDSALSKMCGQEGRGTFCGPTIVEKEICKQYEVKTIGRTEDFKERYYALTVERKMKHPGAVAICDRARNHLFAE